MDPEDPHTFSQVIFHTTIWFCHFKVLFVVVEKIIVKLCSYLFHMLPTLFVFAYFRNVYACFISSKRECEDLMSVL